MTTVTEIRRAGFTLEAHASLANGGALYTYVSRLDERLRVIVRTKPAGRWMLVGDKRFEQNQWDAAVQALAALGEEKTDA